MRKDKKLEKLRSLSQEVSNKAENIRNIERIKEDNRRNTELSIKKMLDTEIYYALDSRQMRRSVQKWHHPY